MALGSTGVAPYAPARVIGDLIDQYRDRSLPTPLTRTTLERAGVEESLSARTLQALKLLDLVDESGEPTETMRAIKVASTADLPSILADWVGSAYREVFAFIEPNDEPQRIIDQFRHYEPAGMRNRMVTLFLGLCVKAGLLDAMPALPRPGRSAPKPKPNGTAKAAKTTAEVKKPKIHTPPPPLHDPPGDERPTTDAQMKAKYFELLLAKAAESNGSDTELLDRIEKLIGGAT